MLKLVCAAARDDKQPVYEFNNNGDVMVQIGDVHHHYHDKVIQVGKLALPHYQDLSHLLDNKKLTEISAGSRFAQAKDIYLGEEDKEIFDIPTRTRQEPAKIECEIFAYNKFKNSGRLSVSISGQSIPPEEYGFSIMGGQDSVNYIYALLKPQVALTCLIEESLSPFGGVDIRNFHIFGVDA